MGIRRGDIVKKYSVAARDESELTVKLLLLPPAPAVIFYSAGFAIIFPACKVNRESVKAARAHNAIVATMGSAVPSKNTLTTKMIAAPVSICRVPANADAIPAIGP